MKMLNPIQWFAWMGQMAGAWILSIPWRDASKAAPAVLLLMALAVGAVFAGNIDSEKRNRLLDEQLTEAIDAEDFKTAELVINRQLRSRPDDIELMYRYAIVKKENGESDVAMALMIQLAQSKRHALAAQYVIQEKYVDEAWSSFSEDERRLFGRLLVLVLEDKPGNRSFRQLYADYLIAVENYPTAIEQLEILAKDQPMRGLQAAALARRLGDTARADRLAKLTLEKVDQLSDQDPNNPIFALAIAQNQLFLKRYEEAVDTLESALQRVYQQASIGLPQDADGSGADQRRKAQSQLGQALGDTIIAWVGHIRRQGTLSGVERIRIMRLLERASQFAPNNPRVLQEIAEVVLATMGESDEELNEIRRTLVQGSNPGFTHFLLGTAALLKDDYERASRELKMASTQMPNSGAVLNNLAVAMTFQGKQYLPEALKISNQAIDLTARPTPHFFETRGQILMRLGNHIDAIPDLERALSVKELAAKAHQSLAVCYDEIGDSDLAKMHRDAAGMTDEKEEAKSES